MKNTLKIALFFIIMIAFLLVVPSICNAANLEAGDEATLLNQINAATTDDVIVLTNDITVTGPIVINSGKTITIDGQSQYSLVGDENWTSTSGNQTMLVAENAGNNIVLKNITLSNGPKYGVQVYNGGTATLENVTIEDFDYGAILVNGGTLTVKSLNLGLNGDPAKGYNGIELSKGTYATEDPVLVMDGTITADQTENVVRLATNDNLTNYTVENGQNAVNKIAVVDNKVVITDEDNNVIYTSNEPTKDDGTTISGSETGATTEKFMVTIHVNNGTIEFLVDEDTVLSADDILAKFDLEANYVVEGYYKEAEYTNEFDFSAGITANTDVYVNVVKEDVPPTTDPEDPDNNDEEKPADEEKDETPETGVSNYIGIAAVIAVASLATIVVIKKKNA